MKATTLISAAICAAMAFAIAGPAGAAQAKGTARMVSARPASHAANHVGIGHRTGLRSRNRQFFGFSQYPYYGYGNYGYYGNQIVENPDEADWAEQWASLYEDNDGPYARSTREPAPGRARMWEIPEK